MKIRLYGDSETIAALVFLGIILEVFCFFIKITICLLPLILKLVLFLLKGLWILIKWICRMIVFLVVYFKEKRNGKSN